MKPWWKWWIYIQPYAKPKTTHQRFVIVHKYNIRDHAETRNLNHYYCNIKEQKGIFFYIDHDTWRFNPKRGIEIMLALCVKNYSR